MTTVPVNSPPGIDYFQQLQSMGAINTVDRDLWRSQHNQTADILNHADRANFTNEYRGNRAFDYLNQHITSAAADGLAAVERNGTANILAGEKNYGLLNSQNERIAAMMGNQAERIGATGIATTEKVGASLNTQAERIGTAVSTQNERIGAGINTQNERIHNDLSIQSERIGAAVSTQNERIANNTSVQSERIASQTGLQSERILNDVKSVLGTNFTETLNGLHDIRARNTDNFAKTWVNQAEQNTLAYRNTSDLARLNLEGFAKQNLELQKVESVLGKQALENATHLMKLNLEGFAKTQMDVAKSEAALSKQMLEAELKLVEKLNHNESRIVDKMGHIENERLRDKTYLGAAKGLILDEYRNGNFDQKCHHHRRRSHSHSRSPSPRRRSHHHHYYDERDDRRRDDDRRINVITSIRDRNDASAGAGAGGFIGAGGN